MSFPNLELMISAWNDASKILEEQLPRIKDIMNPTGKWKDFGLMIQFVPTLREIHPLVQNAEKEIDMALDWENLTQWLAEYREKGLQQQATLRMYVTLFGCDIPHPSKFDANSFREQMEKH